MTGLRLFAIFLIFVTAAFGWVVLGGSVQVRTDSADSGGSEAVGSLWGEPQSQSAPVFRTKTDVLPVTSSDIRAQFQLDQRRKGLLWYSTYAVAFEGSYGVRNTSQEATSVSMQLAFPTATGVYDGFAVNVDGKDIPVTYREGAAVATFVIAPGATARVLTGYKTQGLDEWRYVPTQGVGVVDDFNLAMTTDFEGHDFPSDGVSPTATNASPEGAELVWNYESLVSGKPIAIRMPKPINPGPVAARISFFAPVALAFYFASLVLVSATRKIDIHPMNFAFLAAGFFAFHLLFAYLVDRIDIGWAFAIASVVSVGLCVAYLSAAVPDKRTVGAAAVGQFVFLVLFSFSFFFEGFTGLAVTIGAVLTLAYFMYTTARIDWSDLFERSASERKMKRQPPIELPNSGPV